MKIDRLISIIMILLERKKVSAPELAELCEVSVRTIHRDLEVINKAGVPIVTYPGVHGGVGIMENYKLEKHLFTTADVTTLLMGLGSIRSSLSGDEVAKALAKVQSIIPEDQRYDIELKASQITIDMTPWVGNRSCQEHIQFIQDAMEHKRLIQFMYSDRKLQKSTREIEPYRLILKNMNWYVEGYCVERAGYRIFKLLRMTELQIMEQQFVPRPFQPAPILRPQFHDEHVVMATLRISEEIKERILDYYGEECLSPIVDGLWIAKVPLLDNSRGYRFLLGFGIECECLAPESYRKNFLRYVEGITKKYK